MKHARRITLTDDERKTLKRWTRGRRTPARLVLRAKIVLLAADGMMNKDIAESLKTARKTVSLWRTRFAEQRLTGVEKDAPRGGRPPHARTRIAHAIIEKTTREKPADATHWSTRTLAKALGTSSAMVQRSLDGQRTSAASDQDVQGQQRSAFRGEVAGRGGAVSRSARTCFGALRGRKDFDPSVGPHATRPADSSGPLRHDDGRLQAERHDHVVRRDRHGGGQADRNVHGEASASGVDQVFAANRRGNAVGLGLARDRGQLRNA